MRIACLQFAPQVGEIDNNLNRADAVLAKANQNDVDTLDLLVLPELAFSGYYFGSYDEIAPYLEPSGSGISSLWARTTALKYNTNVLVGYPEQVDISGGSRAGPEQFNSAILVNGDGETVANYRKTFLHSLDETWAREGDEFFGDHVPGLGTTAIGIGGDINPYRLEAPWHAFEFAFHILDVRANLAIVNMAWFTKEDCEQFTQFPNEPDMDALTYWAQRLEPVIRDESRDELIIVFCNRTGIESSTAVYAGTSAIIGIHQGEVKVYGLLGRGEKELLVVDTDNPPFANLTIRKEGVHLSPMEYELKSSGQIDSTEGLLLKPSPVNPGRRTPTKCLADTANSNATSKSPMTKGPLTPPASSILKTSVAECPDSMTYGSQSPAPVSTNPRSSAKSSGPSRAQVDDPDEVAHFPTSTGRILGGSVQVTFEDDQDAAGQASGQCPSLISSGPPPPPPHHALSQNAQSRGNPQEATISVQDRDDAASRRPREPSPRPRHSPALSERIAEFEEACQAQGLPEMGSIVPARPNTATGVRPPRPSSPKSQNASTTRQDRRDQSDVDVPRTADRFDRFEHLHRRTQSVAAQRREYDTTSMQSSQRSSDSRSMSRAGRIAGLDQGLIERALDFYLGSKSVDARDRIFALDAHMARAGSSTTDEDSSHSESVGAFSLDDHSSYPGRTLRTSSMGFVATQSRIDTARTHMGPDEARTVLWKEDSQIVGQDLGRSQSRDDVRGRRRSRGGGPGDDRRRSGGSPSRENPELPKSRQPDGHEQNRTGSQSHTLRRQYGSATSTSNGNMIRSVRDPSLGPPSDSEDEIIAEITFRRPACRKCGSSSCGSKNATRPKTQDTSHTDNKGQAIEHEQQEAVVEGLNGIMPPSPSSADTETPPTMDKHRETTSSPVGLALQTSADALDGLRAPNLSRASLRTLSSYEPSPVTPPPRRFEPRAPKAMIFNTEHTSTLIDSVSNLNFDFVDASLDELMSMSVEIPKASVL